MFLEERVALCSGRAGQKWAASHRRGDQSERERERERDGQQEGEPEMEREPERARQRQRHRDRPSETPGLVDGTWPSHYFGIEAP